MDQTDEGLIVELSGSFSPKIASSPKTIPDIDSISSNQFDIEDVNQTYVKQVIDTTEYFEVTESYLVPHDIISKEISFKAV